MPDQHRRDQPDDDAARRQRRDEAGHRRERQAAVQRQVDHARPLVDRLADRRDHQRRRIGDHAAEDIDQALIHASPLLPGPV